MVKLQHFLVFFNKIKFTEKKINDNANPVDTYQLLLMNKQHACSVRPDRKHNSVSVAESYWAYYHSPIGHYSMAGLPLTSVFVLVLFRLAGTIYISFVHFLTVSLHEKPGKHFGFQLLLTLKGVCYNGYAFEKYQNCKQKS